MLVIVQTFRPLQTSPAWGPVFYRHTKYIIIALQRNHIGKRYDGDSSLSPRRISYKASSNVAIYKERKGKALSLGWSTMIRCSLCLRLHLH